MPKIYVAFKTDADRAGMRMASGSDTTIRTKIREFANSRWRIATYNIKSTVVSMCQIIEDLVKIPMEGSLEDVRVNEVGQVRQDNESVYNDD